MERLIVRTDGGQMYAKLNKDFVLNYLIPNSEGSIVVKKFNSGKEKRVFIFGDDNVFTSVNLGSIYFFQGSYIELGEA